MSNPFIPKRPRETDEEMRMREAINRQAAQLLNVLDSAVMLRNAPSHVQRARAIAKTNLEGFAIQAMHTFTLSKDIADQ